MDSFPLFLSQAQTDDVLLEHVVGLGLVIERGSNVRGRHWL
ncbi:hypothetical protein [Streptomyces mirabilis]